MSISLLQIESSKPPVDLKIGDLARVTGKTQRALRLYEELGLLTPGTRTSGGFRVYGAAAVDRVRWIAKLQDLGFTLPQIQMLVDASSSDRLPKEAMERVRTMFAEKQTEVAQQIARLQTLQKELANSLGYLETCVHDCAATTPMTTAAPCCGTCTTHGIEKAPSLVQGIQLPTSSSSSSSSPSA